MRLTAWRHLMSELNPAASGYPIKLVRDNTPIIINSSGEPGHLFYRKLPDGVDLTPFLRKKLIEEVAEYAESRSTNELLDVLSVLDALTEAHGFHNLEMAIARARAD